MLELPRSQTQVWGHRGASAHARENTVEAFRLAAEQGADGVELDARRTSDGELVVYHNAITGEGRIIVDHTSEELRHHEPWIPSLEEAMTACAGMVVNIEIKNTPSDPDYSWSEQQAETLMAWLDTAGYRDEVVISSFNPATMDRVRALSADVATAQLLAEEADPTQELERIAAAGHQGVNPAVDSVRDPRRLVEQAAEVGLWVALWTVDDPGVIRASAAAGIQAVITNDPRTARAALTTS